MEEYNKNRLDIQGLRAIAVGLVLLFHFWPQRMTGGYIGVDVFFVISGFLITLHLLQNPPTSKEKLIDFWARRIRRLIPAATVVLLVTMVASVVWLPESRIISTSKEVIASAVYVENWQLASTETDYLAADEAKSPVQHYWSLSVEEQFYILWPLLIGGAVIVSKRKKIQLKTAVGTVVGIVFVTSLAYSIYLTDTNQAAAYFVTPTRMWELALGGIMAVAAIRGFILRKHTVRVGLAWGGLAMIGISSFLFTESMKFPGYIALLPTLGAAMVIVAMADNLRYSPTKILKWRPIQYMGDISYSLYLWHWPIIILLPFIINKDVLTLPWKIAGIIVAFGLASLTKHYIEDPTRRSSFLRKSNLATYASGLAAIVIVTGIGGGSIAYSSYMSDTTELRVERAIKNDPCVGAGVKLQENCMDNEKLLSTPAFAKQDKSILYKDECFADPPFKKVKVCSYGNEKSSKRLALFGNSHAGPWIPILIDLAEKNNWRVDTYLVSRCYPIGIRVDFGLSKTYEDNCLSWTKRAKEQVIRGNYRAVVLSSRSMPMAAEANKNYIKNSSIKSKAYELLLSDIVSNGSNALVIRDVPEHKSNIPDCVAKNKDYSQCGTSRKVALEPDIQFDVAKKMNNPNIGNVSVTDTLCDDRTCAAVVGGLIAYFDHGHLTNSFVRTLGPRIVPEVMHAMR